MKRWACFATAAAFTAWLVLPPAPNPVAVVVAIWVDAMLFGLAITPHVERPRADVVVAEEA